jgi:hypothetical protein
MISTTEKHAELATLNADIASGEARAKAQIRHIAELRAVGRDTTQAQAVLEAMNVTLDARRERRRRILDELQHYESRGPTETKPSR